MAKGKNLNPADTFRKSLRKKELKKNKAERSKARDFALVKKDTRDLEDDIQKLDTASELSGSDRARLTDLKSELENINRKKAKYVQEHPEQRRLVYRPRRQEKDGAYSKDDDDDDDIPMPPGPPPGMRDDNDDSDDDVPMPEGPPPSGATSPVPNQISALSHFSVPPPPPNFPGSTHLQAAADFYGRMPPPPPFPQQFPNFPPHYVPPPPPHSMPPPPPGHQRHQSASAMQDPLSSIPHRTFQAHRAGQPLNTSLGSKSTSTEASRTSSKANVEAATVFAAPQLRDFKKEATAFVPTSIKRKKATATSSSKINAAPSLGSIDAELEPGPAPSRPDLLSTLKDQFGHPAGGRPDKGGDKKDDYAKFVEEMGDVLGPVT